MFRGQQIEATWAIANALSNGTDEHVRYLVHQGCIDPMADVMAEADLSTLEAVLEGFDHILRGESWAWEGAVGCLLRTSLRLCVC